MIYLAFLRQGTGCEKSQKHPNQLHFQFLLFNTTKVRLSPTQLYLNRLAWAYLGNDIGSVLSDVHATLW